MKPHVPVEKLWAVAGCCKREKESFSFGVWPLVGSPCSSGCHNTRVHLGGTNWILGVKFINLLIIK